MEPDVEAKVRQALEHGAHNKLLQMKKVLGTVRLALSVIPLICAGLFLILFLLSDDRASDSAKDYLSATLTLGSAGQ